MDNHEELTRIVNIVKDDIGKFELLYNYMIKKIYYWSYSIMNDSATAKDAAQESMIRIYRNIEKIEEPESFSTWAYIIVRNVCYTHLKKDNSATNVPIDELDLIMNNQNEFRKDHLPEESFHQSETNRIIRNCISMLPVKQKEVIVLFYLDEYRIEEISKILDCSPGTVKSRLHTARANLERQLTIYQKDNDVHLASFALIPLLILFLKDHRDVVFKQQDFKYNKAAFQQETLLRPRLKELTLSELVKGLSMTVLVTALLVGGIYSQYVHKNNAYLSDDGVIINELDKSSNNPYINDIVYFDFPTRDSLEITVHLKQKISKDDITVLMNNKKIEFNSTGNSLIIKANENGKYTINILNYSTSFEIDRIQSHAPEVVGVRSYDEYIDVVINDEERLIDYSKSYVEYDGKQYKLNDTHIVYGEFEGQIKIVIFDFDQYRKEYMFNLV